MSTARRVCDERGEHVILRCEPVVSATSMSFRAASMFRAPRARQEHVTCSTNILRCDSEIALRTSLHHALPRLSHDNVNDHRAAAKGMQAEKAARPAAPCASYCYTAVVGVGIWSEQRLSTAFVSVANVSGLSVKTRIGSSVVLRADDTNLVEFKCVISVIARTK